MKENNVFVLSTEATNYKLDDIKWLDNGVLSLNVVNSDPVCNQLRTNKKVSIFGVHNEARINVFVNHECSGNCNSQYVCKIVEWFEKDGITNFIIQVVKKVVLNDIPSMSEAFFKKFFEKRVDQEQENPTCINSFFYNFGPYR